MAKKVTIINAAPPKPSQPGKAKLRVCGYARVSTGSKAQAESYATQVAYFTEKIENKNCPIWLIGYENYSEMLINRLKQYMEDIVLNRKIHYSIYENARGNSNNWEENFRYFQIETIRTLVREKAQVFLIVPINSTLTTFNKLENAIKRKLQDMKLKCNLNVGGYFGVVQVRDKGKLKNQSLTEMEGKYWESINLENKYVKSSKLLSAADNCAHYIVLAKATWENPLECEECYPQECLAELPLIVFL